MSFLQPLGLLGLLAIPIIVIIYILRSKYKTKNVSSTFIWKRSLRYVKRRIPLNFIMSLLLVLQLLTVTVASFAIARPTIMPLKSEEKIVIIDASASMLAKQGDKTRFDVAKEKIQEQAEDIGPNKQISLIVAGSEAVSLLHRETDKGKLLTAMQSVECSTGSADVEGALSLAAKVLEDNAGAKILFYTDKDYIETDGVELVDCKNEGEWNMGIVSFEDNVLTSGTEFIANVANYGASSSCNIKLAIDGKVVGSKTISLDNEDMLEVVFSHSTTAAEAGQTRITISEPVTEYKSATITLNAEDAIEEDNSFTIYHRAKKSPKVMYVSTHVVEEGGRKSCPSSLLSKAFAANELIINSNDMYKSPDDVSEFKGYDLYIFEGVMPEELPTDGAVWVLNTDVAPEGTEIEIDKALRDAEVEKNDVGFVIQKSTLTMASEAVTSIVNKVDFDTPMNFAGLKIPASITKYRAIKNIGTFEAVYSTNNAPIMVAGAVGSVRMIVTTFDFSNSSLFAFVSDFPILIRNMVDYSLPDPLEQRSSEIGESITFNFPAGATSASYSYNGELVNTYEASELKFDLKINKPGKYEIKVNFPDDEETGEKVTETYYVTGRLPASETMIIQRVPTESLDVPEIPDGAVESLEPIELFPYLIAILIALLIIEWGVYYRDQY